MVQVARDVGRYIAVGAASPRHAPGDCFTVCGLKVRPHFAAHSSSRSTGISIARFVLRIAAADIGMHAGKPDLQYVLRLRVDLVEAVCVKVCG
jgi:hypothetical protein